MSSNIVKKGGVREEEKTGLLPPDVQRLVRPLVLGYAPSEHGGTRYKRRLRHVSMLFVSLALHLDQLPKEEKTQALKNIRKAGTKEKAIQVYCTLTGEPREKVEKIMPVETRDSKTAPEIVKPLYLVSNALEDFPHRQGKELDKDVEDEFRAYEKKLKDIMKRP